MTRTLLTPEIEAYRGRVVEYASPEELGRASIRYFATAVGDDNPVYTSDDAARAAGFPGVIAPPTLVCETNQGVVRPRDHEGYIGHTWNLPITGCRTIRGGNEYVLHRPVLPADRITTRWELADLVEKQSNGRSMLIVTSVATYRTETGEVVATNTDTIIYQELPA